MEEAACWGVKGFKQKVIFDAVGGMWFCGPLHCGSGVLIRTIKNKQNDAKMFSLYHVVKNIGKLTVKYSY